MYILSSFVITLRLHQILLLLKSLNSGGSRIFLRGQTPKVGVLTYYFANFCRKLYENLDPRGEGPVSDASLGAVYGLT